MTDSGLRRLVFLLPILFLLHGCGAMVVGGAADGGYAPAARHGASTDAGISATINALYVEHPEVNALDISVLTRQGIVTLRGHVHDVNVRYRAIKIAQGVKGVLRVVSKLEVVDH